MVPGNQGGECFQEEEELSRIECSRQVKENE